MIELKEFMLGCLDKTETKLYDMVNEYNGDFYEHNNVTSLFWEIVEGLEEKWIPETKYKFVATQINWTDVEHSCEHLTLVIEFENQLYGVEYERPSFDLNRLFSKDGFPIPFKPIKSKEVTTIKYSF